MTLQYQWHKSENLSHSATSFQPHLKFLWSEKLEINYYDRELYGILCRSGWPTLRIHAPMGLL